MSKTKSRRVIRRLRVQYAASFDDQLWPVNLALFVLSAFVLGVIIAKFDYNDPRLLYNAWTWTSTLIVSVIGAVWFISQLDNRTVRRSIQLAAVLSIMFHLCLALVMSQYYYRLQEIEDSDEVVLVDEQTQEKRVRVRIPTNQSMTEDFENPVHPEIPLEENQDTTDKRQQEALPLESPDPERPDPESDKSSDVEIQESARREQTVPRRHEETSHRSRNLVPSQLAPAALAATPKWNTHHQKPPSENQVADALKRQNQSSVEQPSRPTEQTPNSLEKPQQNLTSRRIPKPSDPTHNRANPRSRHQVHSGKIPQPTSPTAEIASPTRTPKSERKPSTEQTVKSASSERQSTSSPARSDRSQPKAAPLANSRNVTQATPSRIAPRSTESASINSGPSIHRQRADRTAKLAASPVNAPRLNTTSGHESSRPKEQTARASFNRGQSGLAGAGNTPNFDSGPAAPRSPAMVASAAAPRREATQKDRAASALSPSRPVIAPRRTADADLATSINQTTPSDHATIAGAKQPSEQNADASAANERHDSNAKRGEITAAAGSDLLDTGASKIVSQGGGQRASGGGEPNVGNVNGIALKDRRRSGGASLATLDSDQIAEVPESPHPEAGGGAPRQMADSAGTSRTAETQTPATNVAQASDNPVEPDAKSKQTSVALGDPEAARGGEQLAAAGAKRNKKAVASDLPTRPAEALAKADDAQGSTDSPQGVPLDLAESESGGTTRGLPGAAPVADRGAAEGDLLLDAPEAVKPGEIVGRVKASGDTGAGKALARSAGGRRRHRREVGMRGGLAATKIPNGGQSSSRQNLDTDPLSDGTASGSPGRRSLGPLALAEAPRGPGGLGAELTPDAGISQRPSKRDSLFISRARSRLRNKSNSGASSLVSRVRIPASSFAGRRSQYKNQNLSGGRKPSSLTEPAIESGLDFLARHQSPEDGHWSLHAFPGATRSDAGGLRSDTAATGLALLSFLGAAYDHYDDKYQDVVAAGLNYLIAQQKENGDLYVAQDSVPKNRSAATFYSHAIGTMALCEAYGMTGDEDLRKPAQKALDFIVRTQHPEYGGWRYRPGQDSDTSVTGWQLMALKSGQLAHLDVPQEAFDNVSKWLDRAQASKTDASRYAYRPHAKRTAENIYGRKPNAPMTAVGLLMRLYLGWDRTSPSMAKGADYLLQPENLPSIANSKKRDTYYWYYATQLQLHMGGKRWKAWNDRLHPLLVEQQIQQGRLAGSWNPQSPVADKWGYTGGRIYVTTMNLLSLEVNWRKLPLYEETGK